MKAVLGYGTPTYGTDLAGRRVLRPDRRIGEAIRSRRRGRRARRGGLACGATTASGSRVALRLAFECVIQDDAIHQRIAEGLRDQLRSIGVILDLKPVLSFKAFYETVLGGPASFINKWLWQDPVDAAIGFTASWGSPRPNWQHASIPALDDAYHAWLRAETGEELQAAATQVQLICADELPYIPLLVPQDVWVHRRHRCMDGSRLRRSSIPFYHRTVIEP